MLKIFELPVASDQKISFSTSAGYCRVLGVRVTCKTGFGSDDRIYWTLYTTCYNISQIAITDWTLSASDHITLIHYSVCTELNY
jgi:hypothetical protein